MFPRFLFFVFLFLNINVYSQSLNWSQFVGSTLTFSSPRTVDLNMDIDELKHENIKSYVKMLQLECLKQKSKLN